MYRVDEASRTLPSLLLSSSPYILVTQMKTYTPPALADLGDVRTMTAFFNDPSQTDQISDNGNVSQGNGSVDVTDGE